MTAAHVCGIWGNEKMTMYLLDCNINFLQPFGVCLFFLNK